MLHGKVWSLYGLIRIHSFPGLGFRVRRVYSLEFVKFRLAAMRCRVEDSVSCPLICYHVLSSGCSVVGETLTPRRWGMGSL